MIDFVNIDLSFNYEEVMLKQYELNKEMGTATVRHKKNLFLFEEVAHELAIQLRQGRQWPEKLVVLMEESAKLPREDRLRLIVREKIAGKEIAIQAGDLISTSSMLTRPDDVNAWLEALGAPYRWERYAALPLERMASVASDDASRKVEEVVQRNAGPRKESAIERQERRYQMCIDDGLAMPIDDYAHLPDGIGEVAKKEGIKRQSFGEDIKKHIRRTFPKK